MQIAANKERASKGGGEREGAKLLARPRPMDEISIWRPASGGHKLHARKLAPSQTTTTTSSTAASASASTTTTTNTTASRSANS